MFHLHHIEARKRNYNIYIIYYTTRDLKSRLSSANSQKIFSKILPLKK